MYVRKREGLFFILVNDPSHFMHTHIYAQEGINFLLHHAVRLCRYPYDHVTIFPEHYVGVQGFVQWVKFPFISIPQLSVHPNILYIFSFLIYALSAMIT